MLQIFKLPRLRYDRLYWVLFLVITGVVLWSAITRKKTSFADGVQVEVQALSSGEKLISESDVKQALMRAFGNG